MIPNKYRGVSFDKTQQISRFIGKSWTASHLVYVKTLVGCRPFRHSVFAFCSLFGQSHVIKLTQPFTNDTVSCAKVALYVPFAYYVIFLTVQKDRLY